MSLHVRHLLEGLTNPMMLIFLLVLLIVIGSMSWQRVQIRRLLIALLMVMVFFSTGFFPRYLTKEVEGQYPPVRAVRPDVKWVVVLGGGHAIGDLPSSALLTASSLSRVVEGVRLFKRLPDARLLLSGGGYNTTVSEAAHMADVARLMGVPADAIVVEEDSINTADQAKILPHIVGHDPFYLVTSAFHMKRSMYYCKRYGLKPIPAPTDYTLYWEDERFEKIVLPQAKNIMIIAMHWREWLGLQWAKFSDKG